MSTSACISTRRHPASPAGLLEIAENSRAHRDGLVLARGSLPGAAGLVAKRMSTASARPSHEPGVASSENRAGTSAKLSRSDSAEEPVVLIIDDDVPIQEALRDLIHSVGLRTEAFGSTAELAARKLPDAPRCLILEVRLPGMSGLDFQAQLARANIHIPIVFVTGYGDISMTVRAMKAGAVDFLTKPFRDQDILDAIAKAIARDRMRRDDDRRAAEMRARFDTLRPREREVMTLVTSGLPNKEVAAETDLSEGTVKIHRGRLMKKMGAKSLADLVRMAGILGVSPRVWNLPHNQM